MILIAMNLRPAITAVGPVIDFIRTDLGVSNGVAGLLTTLPLLGFAAMSPVAPQLGRRFGNEMTLFFGLIILFCGIIIRTASWIWLLFLGTTFVGVGVAVGNVMLPGLIKDKFPHRVGLMTSVYTTSMNVLAALGIGLSLPLARGLGLGWSKALACWAVLTVIAMIIWLPQLRSSKSSSNPKRVTSPEVPLWRSLLAWKVTFFMGLQSMAYYVMITWLPEILHDHGLTLSTAGWMASFMQLVGLPGTFIAPIVADRLKDQRPIVIVISVLYFIGFCGLLLGGNFFWTVIWITCFGSALGAAISLSLAFLGLRAANARQAAALSGMAQSVGYLLAAVGPFLIGFLFDLTHSWTFPLLTLLGTGVLMTIAGLGAGRNEYVLPVSQEKGE